MHRGRGHGLVRSRSHIRDAWQEYRYGEPSQRRPPQRPSAHGGGGQFRARGSSRRADRCSYDHRRNREQSEPCEEVAAPHWLAPQCANERCHEPQCAGGARRSRECAPSESRGRQTVCNRDARPDARGRRQSAGFAGRSQAAQGGGRCGQHPVYAGRGEVAVRAGSNYTTQKHSSTLRWRRPTIGAVAVKVAKPYPDHTFEDKDTYVRYFDLRRLFRAK